MTKAWLVGFIQGAAGVPRHDLESPWGVDDWDERDEFFNGYYEGQTDRDGMKEIMELCK